MMLIDENVNHQKFGEGKIISFDDSTNIITVLFSEGSKKFLYPQCFSEFLTAQSPQTAQKIALLLEEENRYKEQEREEFFASQQENTQIKEIKSILKEQPSPTQEINAALKKLNVLNEKLNTLERIDENEMNIFRAVGMLKQEVKHSAFLAFLLNPKETHHLESAFLQQFLTALFSHANKKEDIKIHHRTNEEILLADTKLHNITDLESFLNAKDLRVETEKTIGGGDRRMDIFLESQSTKTVLVLENKVFTSAHDEQLGAYEDKLKDRKDWTKIFVYLTPKGDLPIENATYYDHWCVFSYATILDILEYLQRKKSMNIKLKLLTEDYIHMVNTEILLENQEVRKLCRQIRKEHEDALEILLKYTDNVVDVYDYCENKLRNQFAVESCKRSDKALTFITKPIADYIRSKHEPIMLENGFFSFRCGISSKDGPVFLNMSLEKEKDGKWNESQLSIKNILCPNQTMGSRYHTLCTVPLLSAEERQRDFEDVIYKIDKGLEEFSKKLSALETVLNQ